MSQGANPNPMPRPDTPIAWIVARLLGSSELRALLGTPTGERMPVFQAGQVPAEPDQPDVFIVVKPPSEITMTVYAERYVRSLGGQYLVYAETRSDRLPDGAGFDDVLSPICVAIFDALSGEGDAISPTGGVVWSCNATTLYTPQTLDLTEQIQLKQVGVIATLLATS